jgi:hypothetical protein
MVGYATLSPLDTRMALGTFGINRHIKWDFNSPISSDPVALKNAILALNTANQLGTNIAEFV